MLCIISCHELFMDFVMDWSMSPQHSCANVLMLNVTVGTIRRQVRYKARIRVCSHTHLRYDDVFIRRKIQVLVNREQVRWRYNEKLPVSLQARRSHFRRNHSCWHVEFGNDSLLFRHPDWCYFMVTQQTNTNSIHKSWATHYTQHYNN